MRYKIYYIDNLEDIRAAFQQKNNNGGKGQRKEKQAGFSLLKITYIQTIKKI
jgi:hypothetical protein